MSPEALARLLDRLAPDLDRLDEPWTIVGSVALLILGVPIDDCPDLDILTTDAGARWMEHAWAAWRDADFTPAPDAPFRSRFSRYEMSEGAVEIMGDLQVRTADGWRPVRVAEVERRPFGGRSFPAPSRAEQGRILRLFGRPKDLRRAEQLEAWCG